MPSEDEPGISYILADVPLMTGEDLVDAQATPIRSSPDQRAGGQLPPVDRRWRASSARSPQANVGRHFAIVLDDKVISAPVDPRADPRRLGPDQRQNFTVQSANDLAILLRAGSLPAKLTIVEERTIGPSLGADSIRAGIIASDRGDAWRSSSS